MQVAADQTVVLQGHREPVGGRPGQSGRGHQTGERGRTGLEGAQHERGFVQYADPARVVHALILPSRMLECKSRTGEAWGDDPADGQDPGREGLGRPRRTPAEGEPDLLYIDLHLVHEVTSPQAFDGLRQAGRPVRRPDLTLATEDHNTPTLDIDQPIADPVSRTQVETLRRNCAEFGVRLHPSATPSRASCTSSARSWA